MLVAAAVLSTGGCARGRVGSERTLPIPVGPAPSPAAVAATAPSVNGGVITLYAHDPLARSFSLNDGGYGTVVQDHELKNRDSSVDFNQGT